jgi:hypothetical protein
MSEVITTTKRYRPKPVATRIEIEGDVLVLDQVFCDEQLGGATTKTAQRYDAEGLPFAFVGGRKFRPLQQGRAWLADRIQRKGQSPKRRRRV